MGLNTLSRKNSIKEQREELLKLNNDLLYGVYSLKNESEKGFELEYLEDILTCYPNQLDNLKGLNDNEDITIVNLGALRKGNIEILSGKNQVINNPVLLSNGVIELVEAKNNDGEIKNHLISTLRDGGAADELQRTTTAGRNSTDDLNEDLEREHIEESPFLGYDKDGKLSLATIDNSEESLEILGESINFFLERKYLKKGDENFEFAKKNFERNFPGVKYEDLGEILKDIIDNKKIFTYSVENINHFEGVNEDIKEVSLGDSSGKYFVYFDKVNNTIEYRLLRKITGFNDGFKPLSKRPSRLYLESENQYSRVPRIENASEGYVPTIKYFSEKIRKLIEFNDFDIKFIREKRLLDFLKFSKDEENNNLLDNKNKQFIINKLIESGFLTNYKPGKMENIEYNNEISAYNISGELFEGNDGYLLLDYFKVLSSNENEIELELYFFQNIIDNGAPQTYTVSKKFIINKK